MSDSREILEIKVKEFKSEEIIKKNEMQGTYISEI
jgi:hypothetical protein